MIHRVWRNAWDIARHQSRRNLWFQAALDGANFSHNAMTRWNIFGFGERYDQIWRHDAPTQGRALSFVMISGGRFKFFAQRFNAWCPA